MGASLRSGIWNICLAFHLKTDNIKLVTLTLLLNITLLVQAVASTDTQQCNTIWADVSKSWIKFSENDNATIRNKLIELLPSQKHPRTYDCENYAQAADAIHLRLKALEKSLQKNDEAVPIAFGVSRVLSSPKLQDAEGSEIVHQLIGQSAEKYPKTYLKTVRDEFSGKSCPFVEATNEDADASLELSKRLKSLKNVSDPKLIQIRDLCIKALQQHH